MVMLTELLGFQVRDERGKRAKLQDLCVALLEDDYPPLTHLLFPHESEIHHLDWSEVTAIDDRRRIVKVTDLSRGVAVDDDDDKDVRLRRDLLDALIIDLLGRRTTRVCDLLLEDEDGCLRLKGVDSGLGSMLRRVSRGRLGRVSKSSMFDWKYVEFLRGDPSAVDNGAGYRLRINRLPAGEIARLADLIPYLHAAELIKLLPNEKAADVLESMSIERQLQVIEELPEDEAAELISLMSPDLATDVLGRLDVSTMKRLALKMPEDVRDRIIELLRYPEDSVGGVMVNDILMIPAGTCGEDASQLIQDRLKATDFTSLAFVIDNEHDRKLNGSVSLRDLLTMDPNDSVEDVMDPYLDALHPFDPAASAAHRIVDTGLPAMPVVNQDGKLLGAMTVDAAIAQLVASTSELQMLRVFS